MNTVTLKPANKRLKQLIKSFGTQWLVVVRSQHVQCFDGAGIFIQSIPLGIHRRWVRPEHVLEQAEPELP